MYEIYTDGATSFNGKENAPGGWAYVILQDGRLVSQNSGSEKGTTNQRMELTAAFMACKKIEEIDDSADVKLYSDSAYLINCFNQNWWRTWQTNGWKNSKKEPVANQDLWEKIIPFFMKPQYDFIKVRGHVKVSTQAAYWNDFVDKMAVQAKMENI